MIRSILDKKLDNMEKKYIQWNSNLPDSRSSHTDAKGGTCQQDHAC
jgi:hypothetical protein